MDNKLIQQYGEDILCYKMRTARQKKRMQYEDFDKQLIRINKERCSLYQKQRNLGYEPLIPPVQKGWKRFFVLREDLARSKQAAFFENILKKINSYEWSHRKDFKVKRRKFGRKVYVVKEQKLLQPFSWQFEKLDFTPEQRQFFHPEFHYHQWKTAPVVRYVFNEPWRFVLRIRPNMIDKIKVRDNELESKIKLIDKYLDTNVYDRRLSRLLYGHIPSGYCGEFEKYDEKNPLKNKPLHEILDAVKNESI